MDFRRLTSPIMAAPMAGGPSTPELVAAVCQAGGYGYLAAAYKSVDAVREQIQATRALTAKPFGVNVFVPAVLDSVRQSAAVRAYAERLESYAVKWDVTMPEPWWADTDSFAEKIDLLVADPVDGVSFTFGLPGRSVIDRLHAVGTSVTITVTDLAEARAAVAQGADVLCAQGCEAGGHRSTHQVEARPNEMTTLALVQALHSEFSCPLIAAGGITSAEEVVAVCRAGAAAAQVGTMFLLTDQAGTSAAHRAGLQDPDLSELVVTRAFSGRPARGLRNAFVAAEDAHAPSVFPVVDQLTKPLRAAAASRGDHQHVSLWAGNGWRRAAVGSAAAVVGDLTP
ncbi:NAD(P)H-dependent flavin oxidoreductase [Demetria terragena]|uniref:NAD(P)H-dependent flavin oxidoreductase n=1 Tax=Demetria terragena TaxID=63959 RepID=UPI00036EFE5B|nr:nitronate monooxygenase [Demetria terragena]